MVEDVRHACTTYGFFTLVGHGIPHTQLNQAFEASKRFFAMPDEKRQDVHVGKALGRSFRGWEPPFIQQHKGENLLPDTKEVSYNLTALPCAWGGGFFHMRADMLYPHPDVHRRTGGPRG